MPRMNPGGSLPSNRSDGGFLHFFYKWFLLCGLAGTLVSLAVAGLAPGFSFGLGFLSMALILFLWDVTTLFTLKPKRTSWQWETFLVLVRYSLLGGLFYAMISLLSVRWLWYFAGTSMMVLGLIIAAVRFQRNGVAPDHGQ